MKPGTGTVAHDSRTLRATGFRLDALGRRVFPLADRGAEIARTPRRTNTMRGKERTETSKRHTAGNAGGETWNIMFLRARHRGTPVVALADRTRTTRPTRATPRRVIKPLSSWTNKRINDWPGVSFVAYDLYPIGNSNIKSSVHCTAPRQTHFRRCCNAVRVQRAEISRVRSISRYAVNPFRSRIVRPSNVTRCTRAVRGNSQRFWSDAAVEKGQFDVRRSCDHRVRLAVEVYASCTMLTVRLNHLVHRDAART